MTDSSSQRENPRTVRVRTVILDASIELLLRGGASEVTATRVAEQTGVARTTIYRQWPDQASLLLATIDQLVGPRSAAASSGDLRVDLTNSLSNLRTRLVTRQVRPIFAALVDYAARDEAFVAAQRRFVEGLIQPTQKVLIDAQERGELHPSVDCSVATTTLTGPLVHQFLVMQDTIDDDLITQVTSQFLSSHTAT